MTTTYRDAIRGVVELGFAPAGNTCEVPEMFGRKTPMFRSADSCEADLFVSSCEVCRTCDDRVELVTRDGETIYLWIDPCQCEVDDTELDSTY